MTTTAQQIMFSTITSGLPGLYDKFIDHAAYHIAKHLHELRKNNGEKDVQLRCEDIPNKSPDRKDAGIRQPHNR